MPEQSENMDEKPQVDPLKGTKYEGKSAAEIAQMHGDLEGLMGRQGDELGQLRSAVQSLAASRKSEETLTREPANKDDYVRRYAEDLIVSPEEVLPKLVADITKNVRREVMEEVSGRVTSERQLEDFYRVNPELNEYREIVNVIGNRISVANPNSTFEQILAATKEQSVKYIADLSKRLTGKQDTSDKRRAAITTSGGKAREAIEDEETTRPEASGVDPEQQVILDEVRRIKEGRSKKLLPPRSRS